MNCTKKVEIKAISCSSINTIPVRGKIKNFGLKIIMQPKIALCVYFVYSSNYEMDKSASSIEKSSFCCYCCCMKRKMKDSQHVVAIISWNKSNATTSFFRLTFSVGKNETCIQFFKSNHNYFQLFISISTNYNWLEMFGYILLSSYFHSLCNVNHGSHSQQSFPI